MSSFELNVKLIMQPPDTPVTPSEHTRLQDVITQTDIKGTQRKAKTNLFKRLCSVLCRCRNSKRDQVSQGYAALPPILPEFEGRNTLVLDLDETLVHSSFIPTSTYDFVIPITIEGVLSHAFVAKRPGVDSFIAKCIECFEVVIFTASLKVYAEPLIDRLVSNEPSIHKLFRSSCRSIEGIYVKDLTRLGRRLEQIVIVDVTSMQNSPSSYALQPQNAVAIQSWFCDTKDTDLEHTWRILERLAAVRDIPKALSNIKNRLEATFDSAHPMKTEVETSLMRPGFNSPMPRGQISSFSMS
jgi:RNA polymerase II subunit A small phosphatase-like protein